MPDYRIALKSSAAKELDVLTEPLYSRIEQKVLALSNNPRPAGCRKLKGHSDVWRVRVGDYRVLYTIDDEEMVVRISRIAHRREVYE